MDCSTAAARTRLAHGRIGVIGLLLLRRRRRCGGGGDVRGPTRLCPAQRPISYCRASSGANAIATCCMYRPGPLHLSSSLALHGILFGHRRLPCRVTKVRVSTIESLRCAQFCPHEIPSPCRVEGSRVRFASKFQKKVYSWIMLFTVTDSF